MAAEESSSSEEGGQCTSEEASAEEGGQCTSEDEDSGSEDEEGGQCSADSGSTLPDGDMCIPGFCDAREYSCEEPPLHDSWPDDTIGPPHGNTIPYPVHWPCIMPFTKGCGTINI